MKKLIMAVLTILILSLSASNAPAKPTTDLTETDATSYTTDDADLETTELTDGPNYTFDYLVPEPATLLILTLGAVMIKRKR